LLLHPTPDAGLPEASQCPLGAGCEGNALPIGSFDNALPGGKFLLVSPPPHPFRFGRRIGPGARAFSAELPVQLMRCPVWKGTATSGHTSRIHYHQRHHAGFWRHSVRAAWCGREMITSFLASRRGPAKQCRALPPHRWAACIACASASPPARRRAGLSFERRRISVQLADFVGKLLLLFGFLQKPGPEGCGCRVCRRRAQASRFPHVDAEQSLPSDPD
jgi:hypothetical protein